MVRQCINREVVAMNNWLHTIVPSISNILHFRLQRYGDNTQDSWVYTENTWNNYRASSGHTQSERTMSTWSKATLQVNDKSWLDQGYPFSDSCPLRCVVATLSLASFTREQDSWQASLWINLTRLQIKCFWHIGEHESPTISRKHASIYMKM
jgi:hypothetical protein